MKRKKVVKKEAEASGSDLARLRRNLAIGTSVTVATFGCSSCENNGAVDPPPPPFRCDDVTAGQSLEIDGASLADSLVTIELSNQSNSLFHELPVLTDFDGLALESIQFVGPSSPSSNGVRIVLRLESPDLLIGRFTFVGRLEGFNGKDCDISRRFTVTIEKGEVEVAARAETLPLGCGDRAQIELTGRDGLSVQLRAFGAEGRPISWSVTAGELRDQSGDRVVWTLPETPGFYQIELLTDHGEDGFGFDSLALEVT